MKKNKCDNFGQHISGKNEINGDVINGNVINQYYYIDNCGNSEHNDKIEINDYDLAELEQICKESILNFSLTPWNRSFGLSFKSALNSYCIDPFVTINTNRSDDSVLFSNLNKEDLKKCIILGDAGSGKTFILKKLFVDTIKTGKKALYICADDWNNESHLSNYIKNILSSKTKPEKDFLLIIDGIDEIFATNHAELQNLITITSQIKCDICLGCRTDFYNNAKCLENIPHKRIFLQEWKEEQASKYVKKYTEKVGKTDIFIKYEYLLKSQSINTFYSNPLRLSMLLYIIENDTVIENDTAQNIIKNNEYELYEAFFKLWLKNETTNSNAPCLAPDEIYSQWEQIARLMYMGVRSIRILNIRALISIFKVYPDNENYFCVFDFWHRSFMEFLLAKDAIDSMLTSSMSVIESLKNNNRSDVDFFIKKAFLTKSRYENNKIIKNLIAAYNEVEQILHEKQEIFYVQNQIVYYLTRMNYKSKEIVEFIKDIYTDQLHPIMQQGVAYGAANIGLMDIALDFALKMKDPHSIQNSVNRAWTLIFYGDQPDEDPLNYEDIHSASWKRSKDSRLRRLSGDENKHKAFRMFDLCILHGFYESRNWKDLTASDLEIIENTLTNIPEYTSEVRFFLETKKTELVSLCKEKIIV